MQDLYHHQFCKAWSVYVLQARKPVQSRSGRDEGRTPSWLTSINDLFFHKPDELVLTKAQEATEYLLIVLAQTGSWIVR